MAGGVEVFRILVTQNAWGRVCGRFMGICDFFLAIFV
jgi:hypothetical protein